MTRGRRRRIAVAITLVALTATAFAAPFAADAPPHAVWIIAHAGASSVAPQNTLAAGRAAFALGADIWSVDARRTADGVFVLMHDATLDRTTDARTRFPDRAPWSVASFTLEEIRSLDAGSWFVEDDPFGEIAAGYVSDEDLGRFIGEPVPTLREALELVTACDGRIDIEIKPAAADTAESIARGLIDLIEETGSAEHAMISSFGHDLLRAVAAIAPELPLGALTVFAPPDPLAYLDDLGAAVYLPSLIAFTDRLLDELSTAGIGVHVWTYNTIDQLERLAQTPGITGIVTDYPQRLAQILEDLDRETGG